MSRQTICLSPLKWLLKEYNDNRRVYVEVAPNQLVPITGVSTIGDKFAIKLTTTSITVDPSQISHSNGTID